jgi:signal transduction histidine kinase
LCDGRRIQQMLGNNLVGNAIKYGEAAAAVQVTVTGGDREISTMSRIAHFVDFILSLPYLQRRALAH